MIPHRMLSNEINGSGLKGRVTACRKRLRVNRGHKPQVLNEAEELFPETVLSVSESHSFKDISAAPNSIIRMNCSPEFESSEPNESGTLFLIKEPEVGIP